MVVMGEVDHCKRSSIHQICKHHKCQAAKDFSFYRGINQAGKNWVWGSRMNSWSKLLYSLNLNPLFAPVHIISIHYVHNFFPLLV